MNESLFVQFTAFFKALAKTIEEKVNGKKTEATFLHKEMLTEELSVDLQWKSLTVNSTIVAADIVALDSALPLKKRSSFGTASGDIPKMGMKYQLSEKQMTDIDVLKARNVETSVLVDKIFDDEKRAIMGVHERNEFIFLQGLSTGVGLVTDENNVGTGIRVDYGYSADNKYGAEVAWSVTTSKPINDIKRVINKAKVNGDNIKVIMMSDTTFDTFAENEQTRQNFAFSQNFAGENANIPVPDLTQINTLMQRKFGVTIVVVDRTITTERDGVRTVHTPWDTNKVVFLTSPKVGKLVYGILAEETRKSPKVMYTKSGSFILLKKWSSEEPFAEWTSSQALVLPVIDNVNSIYVLDVEEAEDDTQTESNSTINIFGDTAVLRANLITALTAIGVKNVTDVLTDAELLKVVNKLSDAKVALLVTEMAIPVVSAGADTTSSAATKALTGTATAAGDKTIASVQWSHVSGPNTAGFTGGTTLTPTATGLVTGTYVFKLTATDSEGIVASDTVTVVATVV